MNSRCRFVLVFLAVSTITLSIAVDALATHVTVRADGSGDYPSINAAMFRMGPHPPDTVIVEPGLYDEIVENPSCWYVVLYGRAGAESTHVRGLEPAPCEYYGGRIAGITIDTFFACPSPDPGLWYGNPAGWSWEDCVFAAGFRAYGGGLAPTKRCTFRGPAEFYGFNDLADCTFDGAQAFFENSIGYVMVARCTFRGPSEDLVVALPRDESGINFVDCTFSDAGNGIRVFSGALARQSVTARHCRFERLTGSAFEYVYDDGGEPQSEALTLTLENSFALDVGRAVRARSSLMINLAMTDDTIATTHDTAIDATVRDATLQGIDLNDVEGAGMRLEVQNHQAIPYYSSEVPPATLDLIGCHVRDCRGDGVRIAQLPNPSWDPGQRTAVRASVIELNTGTGLRLLAPTPIVTDCMLRGNGGDGLNAIAAGDAPACSLSTSTSVENHGQGIVVQTTGVMAPLFLDHDLVTQNALGGIAVLGPYSGSASRNDAWANGGVPVSGVQPGEINLQVDPLYCMPGAGDFELRVDSPCAPSGVYGQIGAFGVGCSVPTAVPLTTSATTGLRIVPNPSRSPVTFAWGAGARMDALEVFDPLGRRRWAAAAGDLESGSLHWSGRSTEGRRLPPGVYLVRWRAGARSGTSRLVLLDE